MFCGKTQCHTSHYPREGLHSTFTLVFILASGLIIWITFCVLIPTGHHRENHLSVSFFLSNEKAKQIITTLFSLQFLHYTICTHCKAAWLLSIISIWFSISVTHGYISKHCFTERPSSSFGLPFLSWWMCYFFLIPLQSCKIWNKVFSPLRPLHSSQCSTGERELFQATAWQVMESLW